MNVWKLACLISSSFYLSSCHSPAPPNDKPSPAQDSLIALQGAAVFNQHCSGCHNFKQSGIGPNLAGLTRQATGPWIARFIKDPKKLIESGDERATRLYKLYKTEMPSFSDLSDGDLKSLVAYIGTHKKREFDTMYNGQKPLTNPLLPPIPESRLEVALKLITQFPASVDSGKIPVARITKLDYQRGTGKLFVVDLRGKLYRLDHGKPAVYMDLPKLRPKFTSANGLGVGFGSFAFHPDFPKNGLLYTVHTEVAKSGRPDFSFGDSIRISLQCVVTEWKTAHPEAATFNGSGRELLRADMVNVIHGIQEITFNPLAKRGSPDYGKLYICVGDGGSVDEGYPFLAHSRERIWGTLLRIDPAGNNSPNGHYGIPADNPFVDSSNPQLVKEIYAYGFRNPHRITWSKNGQMLVSVIGGENIEMVDWVKPGQDYGWPIREGNFTLNPYGDITKVYLLPADDSAFHITYPIAEFDHHRGISAISGGYEYQGRALPLLKGKFLFGDIPSGKLFFIEMNSIHPGSLAQLQEWNITVDGVKTTLKELCKRGRVDLHFGRDAKGELYIMTKTDGKLYKLVSAKMSRQ